MQKKFKKSMTVEPFCDEDSPLMCTRFGLLLIWAEYHAASPVCSMERRLSSPLPQNISTYQGEGRFLESTTDRAVKRTKFLEKKFSYTYGYRCNNKLKGHKLVQSTLCRSE